MEKIKYIIFEYFVLMIVLILPFLHAFFINSELNNYIFVIYIMIIYARHHHLGQQVIIEMVSENLYCTRGEPKKRIFPLMDCLTLGTMILIISDYINFWIAGIIFVIWFIFTDIFRARKTIYGTYVSRWFYTSKININNNMWIMHKADSDPFPSVPHMHAKNMPLKLDIYTGIIYDSRNNQKIQAANKKDLKKLWSDKKFVVAVEVARKIYLRNHPTYKLESLPNF